MLVLVSQSCWCLFKIGVRLRRTYVLKHFPNNMWLIYEAFTIYKKSERTHLVQSAVNIKFPLISNGNKTLLSRDWLEIETVMINSSVIRHTQCCCISYTFIFFHAGQVSMWSNLSPQADVWTKYGGFTSHSLPNTWGTIIRKLVSLSFPLKISFV